MIRFREHMRGDIPLRVKWLNNKAANRFAIDNPAHVTTIEEQESWFADYETNNTKKFFTICDEDHPIGFMGLSKIDTKEYSANLFILIGEDDYRGKGIGKLSIDYLCKFAFDDLGLTRVELEVNKQNKHAIETFKSTGFTEMRSDDEEVFMERIR